MKILLIKHFKNKLYKFFTKNFTEQKNFIKYGIINSLITISSLQILLLFIDVAIATFISQTINTTIGFFLYGKKVFRKNKIKLNIFISYIFLSLCIWIFNWFLIESLTILFKSKNLSALIIILPGSTLSYLGQKYFVFR